MRDGEDDGPIDRADSGLDGKGDEEEDLLKRSEDWTDE
jgi:hypothetical protein